MATPESALQFDATEPNRDTFTFAQAETHVDFATAHDMRVRGQSLLWHPGLPAWLTSLSGATRRAAMNDHVRQVAAHFAGRIYAGDVVNEAFSENGLRRASLVQATGDDWIEDAFRTARAADPAAKRSTASACRATSPPTTPSRRRSPRRCAASPSAASTCSSPSWTSRGRGRSRRPTTPRW